MVAGIQVFYCRFTSTEQVGFECEPKKETDADVRQGTLCCNPLLFLWQGLGGLGMCGCFGGRG